MEKELLKTQLMMLGGVGRPTITETVDGVEVEVVQWSENDMAKTIQTIMDDNQRLERELKESRERYINDFLSAPNTDHGGDNQHNNNKKSILPSDYLDF